MKKFLAGLSVAFLLVAGVAIAQTSNYFPVPSNIWSATGAVVVAQDGNNLTGVAAVTPGYVLASQGEATLPAWERLSAAEPSLTPTEVAAATCAEQAFTVTGVLATDTVTVSPPVRTTNAAAVAARASDADTVAILFCNPQSTGVVPDAGSYRLMVFGL
jgi:hypothetical protein